MQTLADGTVIEYAGHRYSIPHLHGEGRTLIQFDQRLPLHPPREGILIQNLLRVTIDRLQVLNAEKPWADNDLTLRDLRVCLARQEARALIESVKKGKIVFPELLPVGSDGHLNWLKLLP